MRRAQQTPGLQKKKGNRTKKGKKVRGASSEKLAPGGDAVSEDESEVGRESSSPDLEASAVPFLQVESLEACQAVKVEVHESASEGDDVEMHAEEEQPIIIVEIVTTPEGIYESVPATRKVDVVCGECLLSHEHSWGCATHRVYTSSLLLMHRQMRVAIVRGPPGLELLASIASPANAGMCSMRAA